MVWYVYCWEKVDTWLHILSYVLFRLRPRSGTLAAAADAVHGAGPDCRVPHPFHNCYTAMFCSFNNSPLLRIAIHKILTKFIEISISYSVFIIVSHLKYYPKDSTPLQARSRVFNKIICNQEFNIFFFQQIA